MGYRYLNPGYGDLFEQTAQTSFKQETNADCTTGVCFHSCGTRTLPTPLSGTKEMWAKFEAMNCRGGYGGDFICFYGNADSHRVALFKAAYNDGFRIRVGGGEKETIVVEMNVFHSYFIHIKSDATDGLFELYKDGELAYKFIGNVLNGSEITKIYSVISDDRVKLSNIIVSDSEVKTTENVYVVPATISTTMTDNSDGTYTADTAGEYVNMTPNIPSGAIPTGAKITGYAVAAQNAYYDGDGLNKLDVTKDGANMGEFTLDTTDTTSNIIGFSQNMDVSVFAASVYGLRAKNDE